MKNCLVLLFLMLFPASLLNAEVSIDDLKKKVEQSNRSGVSILMRKFKFQQMAVEKRKETLADLYELASRIVKQRRSSLPVVGNWRDAGKTMLGGTAIVVGSGVFLLSCLWLFAGPRSLDPAEGRRRGTAVLSGIFGGGFLAICGATVLYGGVIGNNQKSIIKKAEDIQNSIAAALADVEEREG